jgi:hypothetical protein
MAKSKPASKQVLQERTKLEWVLLALLLVILYLLFATHFLWWPWSAKNNNFGTAFYSPTPQQQAQQDSANNAASNGGGSNGGSGSTGNSGANGASGSNGSNGSNGGTTTPPPATSSALLNFAATLDTGNSKQDVSGRAGGLNESCVLVANASAIGKQEVCTYTEGDKLVTVTYLNDKVVSASRTGF